MSAPFSTKCVANECRKVCGLMFLLMLANTAALLTMVYTIRNMQSDTAGSLVRPTRFVLGTDRGVFRNQVGGGTGIFMVGSTLEGDKNFGANGPLPP